MESPAIDDRPNMVPTEQLYSDLNIESALEVIGGDRKLLRDLADIFLQECPELLYNLRGAVLRRDSMAVEANAHKLRGSMSNFGAPVAAQGAERLETMGSSSNLTEVDEAFEHFEIALNSFVSELKLFRS